MIFEIQLLLCQYVGCNFNVNFLHIDRVYNVLGARLDKKQDSVAANLYALHDIIVVTLSSLPG